MRIIRLFLILALFCPLAFADADVVNKGRIALLALVDNGTAQTGTVATLELELRPGQERVFLHTFPLTKITTQASLRFAQQVACNELEIDCSGYDFLFTINALPGIVGGPSAGSAAAALTASLLLNESLSEEVALTGTINSGGLVGRVGGVRQKIEAATDSGIKTVYVPQGSKALETKNNTVSIVDYAKVLNITVIEVATLNDILSRELGVPEATFDEPLRINERYLNIMEMLADDLCSRSANSSGSRVGNFTERAEQARENEEYYSAASYCFRANVEQSQEFYRESNFTVEELQEKVDMLKSETADFQSEVQKRNITTLTDLQTYMAVMERLNEANSLLAEAGKELEKNNTPHSSIGFAEERLVSAKTWSLFFGGSSNHFHVNNEKLKQGCAAKISEAEERYSYVKSVIPSALDATRDDIDHSYELLRSEKYAMCIYTAAKAKAEADLLLGLLGVEEGSLDEVIDLKLLVARHALMKAQKQDIFPIIAYSYYEYANSLQDFDKVSSLLFSEYALELANLEIYFNQNNGIDSASQKLSQDNLADALLVVISFLVFLAVLRETEQ